MPHNTASEPDGTYVPPLNLIVRWPGEIVVTPERLKKVIVGVYLSSDDRQPRFRQICDDFASARQDIAEWLRVGYVETGLDGGCQDHYPPSQIYKFRLMPVTKVVTARREECDSPQIVTGEAYWLDESSNKIDPWTVPM